jgi:uncharacterized repeat protein (TIGR01451 family)
MLRRVLDLCWPYSRIRWIGLAVVACCFAFIPASASADEISGLVFNDFNTNGVFDNSAVHRDIPLEGWTVKAFTGTNTEVGHADSAADGRYHMHVPNTTVRLELFSPGSSSGIEPPFFPTRIFVTPGGVRSDVQFVDASSPKTDVDFAVHNPSQWSLQDPILFWPTQWAGPPGTSTNPNDSAVAIRGAPYSSRRTGAPGQAVQSWSSLPLCTAEVSTSCRVERATFAQIGTVFGLAIDNRTDDLYAGAYQKRFSGLKDGPGAIFKITPNRQVSVFANLPAGTDPHPMLNGQENPNIEDWVNCGSAANGNTPSTLARCDFSWTDVGKIGLGDLVIDPQDQNLYAVNLENSSLYRIPLSAPGQATATAIPDPGCVGGVWRPFSAGFDVVNNQLYVGGVCDAETSQAAADLRAVVYRVDNPQSAGDTRAHAAAPTFVQVLSFALNYQRAPSPNFPGNTVGTLTYCSANTTLAARAGGFCRWNPWPTLASTDGFAPSNTMFGNEQNNASYPQLTAITFAEDGSMILGFRDLMGDMAGVLIPGEMGGTASQPGLGPMVHGDMLRAGANDNGTFTLESVGSITSNGHVVRTSAGQSTSPINWRYGAGIGPGPCAVTTAGCIIGNPGGYFYNPTPLAGQFDIPHPYQGGLIQIPGFADVVATSIHIRAAQENGLLWRNNDTGATTAALQNYITPSTTMWNGFAKSNGLGDLTGYTGAQIQGVQIGNRLWYDTKDSGIQEPSEAPVTDARVDLYDCHGHALDTTDTDSQGEYAFNVDTNTCYQVRVPLGQPKLVGWKVTRDFVGGHASRINSKCLEEGANAVIDVAGHGPGENTFTYDCGFVRGGPPPPPPPPPPPHHELEVIKSVLSQVGHTVHYGIIVRNSGTDLIVNVHVCDPLPAGLVFVSASAGHTRTGREVCWHIALLPSGAQETFHLTARVRAGTLTGVGTTNCVDARGTGEPEGPDLPGKPVGPVRACATVHAAVTPPRPPPPTVTG